MTCGAIFFRGGGGPKWHFSDFKMHFWGFGVPGLRCRSGAFATPTVSNVFGIKRSWEVRGWNSGDLREEVRSVSRPRCCGLPRGRRGWIAGL